MVIAVDFDGTIVENCHPQIGAPKIFAFETLREMAKERHLLILWTTRTGEHLREAVEFCASHGVQFYAVNSSFPEEKYDGTSSRKINCEMFISHKNLGGMDGWGEMWQYIQNSTEHKKTFNNKPPGIFDSILKLFKK